MLDAIWLYCNDKASSTGCGDNAEGVPPPGTPGVVDPDSVLRRAIFGTEKQTYVFKHVLLSDIVNGCAENPYKIIELHFVRAKHPLDYVPF